MFTCEKCDREQYWHIGKTVADGAHLETHPVVRCPKLKEKDPTLSTEQQLKDLHAQMDDLHVKVEQLDNKLAQLEHSVVERVTKNERAVIEKLEKLERLLGYISPQLISNSLPIPASSLQVQEIASTAATHTNGHALSQT